MPHADLRSLALLTSVVMACNSPATTATKQSAPPRSASPAVAATVQALDGTEMLLTSDTNLVHARWTLRYPATPDPDLDEAKLLSVLARHCLRCVVAAERYEALLPGKQWPRHTSALRESVLAQLATVPGIPKRVELDPLTFEPPAEVKAQLARADPAALVPSTPRTPAPSAPTEPAARPTPTVKLEPGRIYTYEERDQSFITRDKKKVRLDVVALWRLESPESAKELSGHHHAQSMVRDVLGSQLRQHLAEALFSEVTRAVTCAPSSGDPTAVQQAVNEMLADRGLRVTALFIPGLRMDPDVVPVLIERMVAEVARKQKGAAAEREEERIKQRALEEKQRWIDQAKKPPPR